MKKNVLPLTLLAALMLTACGNEDEQVQDVGRVPLQVTSGIQTRAVNNQWEADDAIGIYAFEEGTTTVADNYANVRYTTSTDGANGTFTPAGTTIYLPTDNTTRDFVAYYPQGTLANDVYAVDVKDQSDQSAIDLMSAGTQHASRFSPTVTFNFTHKLSKVEVTLQAGDGLTASDLAGLKVELTGQRTAATFDVKQPTSAVVVDTEIQPATISLLTAANGQSAEAIVLPSADYAGMSLLITLADGNSVFTWALANSVNATKFEEGKKYLYNITLNKTEIIVTATISNWEPGNGTTGETGSAY